MSEVQPEINYADYAFGGNIAAQADLAAEYANRFDFPFSTIAAEGLASVVGVVGVLQRSLNAQRIVGANRYLIPQTVRIGAARASMQKEAYDERINAAEPPQMFQDWKGELTWAHWLRRPAYRGGPTRSQLRQVLQWNMRHMQEENTALHGEFEIDKQAYLNAADTAVDEGRISPLFAEKAHAIIPGARIVVSDPLNPGTIMTSWADSDRSLVMLESSSAKGRTQTPHEETHLLGGFKGKVLNEVTTDMLSSEIQPEAEPSLETKSGYVHMERAVGKVLQLAGVTSLELSKLYVGNDKSLNSEALSRLVRSRTGEDMLSEIETYYLKRVRHWRPRVFGHAAFASLMAGTELLKRFEPDMTYRELLLRDDPEFSEESADTLDEMMSLGNVSVPAFYWKMFRSGAITSLPKDVTATRSSRPGE